MVAQPHLNTKWDKKLHVGGSRRSIESQETQENQWRYLQAVRKRRSQQELSRQNFRWKQRNHKRGEKQAEKSTTTVLTNTYNLSERIRDGSRCLFNAMKRA